MNCTRCSSPQTHVLDSRVMRYGVRRRRECEACGERWTTYELAPPPRPVREKAAA